MRNLSAKLDKKDASLAFMKTLHWNVSTSVDICSMHDGFLATAKDAEDFKADKTRYNEIRDKIRKRRAEYRFKEDTISHFQPYSDIVPDPNVTKRRLKGNRESYNRKRREERERKSSTRGRGRSRGRGRRDGRFNRYSNEENKYGRNDRYKQNNRDKRFNSDKQERRQNNDNRRNNNDRRNRDQKKWEKQKRQQKRQQT